MNIDKIVRDNKVFRFGTELQYTENEENKTMLREILRNLQNDRSDKITKALHSIGELSNNFNKARLQKKWFRLTTEQQIERINSFFEEKIENETERKTSIEKTLELLKNEKTKKKLIEYDENNGKIINVVFPTEKKEKEKKTKKNKKENTESEKSTSSEK